MLGNHSGGVRHRHRNGRFRLKAGHRDAGEAAWGDGEKRRQGLTGYIDREAVHGDPFANADTDGCEFPILHPYTCHSIAAARAHPQIHTCGDERVLDEPQVQVEIPPPRIEVKYRVADELARTMVGSLSSAVGLENWMRQACSGLKGGLISEAPDGVNGFVFEEENRVRFLPRQYISHGAILKL